MVICDIISFVEYVTPRVETYDISAEGVLCMSGNTNESYPGVPDDDETIF